MSNQEIEENNNNETEENEEESENSFDDESNSLEDKIKELEEKNKELEDKYLRANAEFENIKKRLEREKMQAVSYANEEFARDLLPVIDSMDFAANSANVETNNDEYIKKIEEGINLTIEQFKKVMQKHGIELIDANEEFNPHLHNAVMQVESEKHKEGEIVELLQKGYKMKDRVLRPAMVSVAK